MYQIMREGGRKRRDLPLSFPRMKMKTDCRPKRFKKYHDRLETHRTSRSRVMTPDCSIDLKRMVRGKGSFTASSLVSRLVNNHDLDIVDAVDGIAAFSEMHPNRGGKED